MPANPKQSVVILDEADEITLADLTRACRVQADWVMELVEEGVIEPRGKGGPQWRFAANFHAPPTSPSRRGERGREP